MTLVVRGIAPEYREYQWIYPSVFQWFRSPASPFCLFCDCVISSGIPSDADFSDWKGFFHSRHDSGSFAMAAGRFNFLPMIYKDIMGLDPVPCGTDRPFAFWQFRPAVWPQVLCVRVMVPVCTSVKELLSGLFTSVPGVYAFCVIELLQDPVVPPLLL